MPESYSRKDTLFRVHVDFGFDDECTGFGYSNLNVCWNIWNYLMCGPPHRLPNTNNNRLERVKFRELMAGRYECDVCSILPRPFHGKWNVMNGQDNNNWLPNAVGRGTRLRIILMKSWAYKVPHLIHLALGERVELYSHMYTLVWRSSSHFSPTPWFELVPLAAECS